MPDDDTPSPGSRARRIQEALLEIDGVVAVRVWESGSQVEIGIQPAPTDAPSAVLLRAREVTEALRGPDETWEIGLLNELGS